MGINRAGFLSTLMKKAAENGNTIYEELQGNSVIASSVGDWNEALKKAKKGVDKAAALISPTIDATPGRRTLEDTIDEFIFDPRSNLAPLELFALGASSTSAAAAKGLTAAARKMGWNVSEFVRGGRTVKGVADPVVRKAGKVTKKPVATVREGFQHDVGGLSPESFHRDATGTKFFKIDRAGKATPVIQNAEDAGSLLINKGVPGHAIVKVGPRGSQLEGGALANRAMQTTFDNLKPGKIKDVGETVTHTLKSADDDVDFLKKLGVRIGKGPPK